MGRTRLVALYIGGIASPLALAGKTLLLVLASIHCVVTRLWIDQTVGLWWRYGALLVLLQWLLLIAWKGVGACDSGRCCGMRGSRRLGDTAFGERLSPAVRRAVRRVVGELVALLVPSRS